MSETSDSKKRFCGLPWVHMYFDPSGNVYPCCLRDPRASALGNLDQNTPEEIWNSENMKTLRNDFQKGVLHPEICNPCYLQEDAGSLSHRQQYNQLFSKQIKAALKQTSSDGTLSEMKFAYWDFRLSNVCNFKCRTCNSEYSSSWEKEEKEHGIISHRPKKTSYDSFKFAFSQIPHINEFYFAGGEPFMMKEHYQTLEELLRLKRTDVKLSYNSNCSVLKFAKWDAIEILKNFKKVQISPSIDHTGARAELVRKGTIWNEVVQNIQTIKKEIPWLFVRPTITVSIFNILSITQIHRDLMECGIIYSTNPEYVTFNILYTPEHFSVGLLTAEQKKKVTEDIQEYRNWCIDRWGRDIPQFNNVIEAMNIDQSSYRTQFLEATKVLDKIRNEDFFSVFPELSWLQNI